LTFHQSSTDLRTFEPSNLRTFGPSNSSLSTLHSELSPAPPLLCFRTRVRDLPHEDEGERGGGQHDPDDIDSQSERDDRGERQRDVPRADEGTLRDLGEDVEEHRDERRQQAAHRALHDPQVPEAREVRRDQGEEEDEGRKMQTVAKSDPKTPPIL